ncbi:MAG: 2-oxoglutarate and iron-dependent oxygenase domain-containing protein, partial [Halieaceae bacterium]
MPAPIPIIDLADHEEQILPTLERALCDIGFVLVTGHDVPAELVRNLRQHLIDYFDRPLVEKMAERITPDNYRGYIPLGFFSPNTEGITPDQYEGYKLHAEVAADDPLRTACDLYGPNRWPDEPAGLRETTEAFWQACEATGQRLL